MVDSPAPPATAAVAMLVFNRPDVTALVADAVSLASPRALYVIADGPRPDHPEDEALCERTRDAVLSREWGCPVHTLLADTNMGLRARVSTGLDWLFEHEAEAIIVEDDCVADPSFFRYATELLERYRDDERVGVISGNNFLRGHQVSGDSYFFTRDTRIWGWATWSRVWRDFSKEGLRHQWSSDEAAAMVSQLDSPARQRALRADAERAHRINSWALPFVLHSLRRGYLNVTPRVNLVSNVGFGAKSTHTKFESFTAEVPRDSLAFPLIHPSEVVETQGVGAIETAEARKQWLLFPLLHPVDFAGRVWRYLSGRFFSARN